MSARRRVAVTLTQCWHRVPGGTATSVLGLLDALSRTGEVDLVGVGPRGDLRRPGSILSGAAPEPWAPRSHVPGVPIAQVPLPLPVLYDAWARTGRPSIEAATGPVDLVHVTVPIRVPVGEAPIVATVHDLIPLTDPDRLTARGARLTTAGLEWIREHAAAVMVPSELVARDCAAHGFAPERVRVVPWGVEVHVPDDAAVADATARHGISGPYVAFVGTIEPRKNVDGFLRAVAQLDRPGLTTVLIGPSGWGAVGDDAAGVPGPLVRTGFVDSADLAALVRGAAAFCFPSFAEGFGLPVLEAMAAGAAVVTSAGTSMAEIVDDAGLLVDPHDDASIAAALDAVLRDPDTNRSLRELATRRAAGFTWADAARRTLEVYRGVLR